MDAAAYSEQFLLTVLVQLLVIIGAARLGGWLLARLGQPQVVGEIAAGLLLGPSALGRMAPQAFEDLFPPEADTVLRVFGQLGLVFLMFQIGLEFEFSHLRRLGRMAVAVALAGILAPFGLGILVALAIHKGVAGQTNPVGFMLFLATALSITAIPVLGRIMLEFGISRTPLGALTISAAAVDDALGWILLAAVSAAVAGHFDPAVVLRMLALTFGFVLFLWVVVRPVLVWWSRRALWRGNGQLTLGSLSVIIVAVLASAVVTNWIGIFSIFGPFVLGAILCDQSDFRAAVLVRLRDFVTAFFLPVFFSYTGLRTNIGLLSGQLWLVCGLVLLAAVAGKVVGCGLAARIAGMTWSESASVAVMMNTRGLMGLVAANLGKDMGVIPDTVFCMLVIMSLVTTFLASPLLRRLLPAGEVAGGITVPQLTPGRCEVSA